MRKPLTSLSIDEQTLNIIFNLIKNKKGTAKSCAKIYNLKYEELLKNINFLFKEEAKFYLRQCGNSQRTKNGYKHSIETKNKISNGNIGKIRTEQHKKNISECTKKAFKNEQTWNNYLKSREKSAITRKINYPNWHNDDFCNKIHNAHLSGSYNNVFTNEVRQKMKEQAINRDPKTRISTMDKMHSGESRQKAIKTITEKYNKLENEKYKFNKPPFISKAEIEISNIIRENYNNVKNPFFVKNKLYDIYIPDLNLIIEYNGDFWHCNPDISVYNENYFHPLRKLTFNQIKEYDQNKINFAKENGYKILIIWENDYKNSQDKKKFIMEKINSENSIN